MLTRVQHGKRRLVELFVWVAVVAIFSLPASPAFGAFNTSKSGNATFTAVTLLAPVKLNQVPNGNRNDCKVTLSWTIPQPGIATNWVLQRFQGTTESSGYIILAPTATSYIDDAVNTNTTYTWKIVSLVGTSWTSPILASNAETLTNSCT